MVDQFMAEHTKPTTESKTERVQLNRNSVFVTHLYLFVMISFLLVTHGLVLLKMKKALPDGIGGVFSLMVSSDSL